ncbi:MAG: hypothetical protein ACRD1Y_02105, partial [Terriglobales bacterium]
YTLELKVDGKTYTRAVRVINDPRVGQSAAMMAALRAQNRLNRLAYEGMQASYKAGQEVAGVEKSVAKLEQSGAGDVRAQARRVAEDLKPFAAAPGGFGGFRRRAAAPGAMQSFRELNNTFSDMIYRVQVGYDMAPTPAQLATGTADCKTYEQTLEAWNRLESGSLMRLNQALTAQHEATLALGGAGLQDRACGR